MRTLIFKSAVAAAKSKPKAVIVSLDLFRALDADKALERKLATPWGLPAPSLGIDLPYFDSDVYVACDPSLDDFDFKLPVSPEQIEEDVKQATLSHSFYPDELVYEAAIRLNIIPKDRSIVGFRSASLRGVAGSLSGPPSLLRSSPEVVVLDAIPEGGSWKKYIRDTRLCDIGIMAMIDGVASVPQIVSDVEKEIFAGTAFNSESV